MLATDYQIVKLIGKDKVFLLDSDKVQEQIIFNLVPVTDNKIIRQYRLEITIIAFDMTKIDAVSNRVKEILITLADEEKGKILDCALSGGGLLRNYDTNTLHQKLYFGLKTRGE